MKEQACFINKGICEAKHPHKVEGKKFCICINLAVSVSERELYAAANIDISNVFSICGHC